MVLYKETDDNPLFNEFACFVLDRLHTFPNMHDEYAVSPGFDVAEYVSHKTTLHDGTIIYRFSKELMAYLETCVAFSPYYRADDPRAAAHIDKYYKSALNNYNTITYDEFHAYLTDCLTQWYEKHPPPAAGSKRRVSSLADDEAGDVIDDASKAVEAEAAPAKKRFSLEPRKPRAAAPAGAAAAPAPAPADAATDSADGADGNGN